MAMQGPKKNITTDSVKSLHDLFWSKDLSFTTSDKVNSIPGVITVKMPSSIYRAFSSISNQWEGFCEQKYMKYDKKLENKVHLIYGSELGKFEFFTSEGTPLSEHAKIRKEFFIDLVTIIRKIYDAAI